ncbi:MAG TPA: HAMP domain-containing sensor histidine kinase [Dehalococcoidia bacterium]|nr:HAMP domain-containing sensor histidine kinase [Dehalococcoidia bacterium]
MVVVNARAGASDVRLVAAIAHDLRNPLAAIRANTQLLRLQARRADPSLSAWLDFGMAEIEEAEARMEQLVDEFVELARIQSGGSLPLNRRQTDLVELVSDAISGVPSSSGRHLIRFVPNEPTLSGHWDATQVWRALENLLGNAMKYSPPDREIVVSVAREQAFAGNWAVVVVCDQGRGIPAADQAFIFEPFWRGSNVGLVAGSGLGLASVKQIAEAHGGSIVVDSREAEGTSVTVRLPLARAAEPPNPPNYRGRDRRPEANQGRN